MSITERVQDRAASADLEDFFENGTIGLHLVAADGTILKANRADYQSLGYSADEYVGHSIMDFHADADVIADILQRLSSGEKLDKYPARLKAKDGSIRYVQISSSVCFRDGEFLNTRCFTVDVTDKIKAEAELREAQERLTVTYENVLAGISEVDTEGCYTRVNEAFVTITGYSRDELIGMRFTDITHPDDVDEDWAQYQRQIANELDHYVTEKRFVRKDGQPIWVEVSSSTVRGPDGEFGYGVRMAQDVTERKLAEQHRKLLLAELNHRVKNTLATVQALAAHTARNAQSAEDFRRRFEPRLMALSAAHDRLTRNDWRGADLADIVADELQAHGAADRASVNGPGIILPPRVSLSLSMALHELATNALKYGALSEPNGAIRIDWSVERERGSPYPTRLVLSWEERDGPTVHKPEKEGFGSRLLRVTAGELRGELATDWRPEGLAWNLSLPLAASDFELAA
jgi:PAS domain S-box-containing protein